MASPEHNPPRLDPNPHISLNGLSGSDVLEPFVRLVGRQIDTLTIDGSVLVGVLGVTPPGNGTTTLVECSGIDGSTHLFSISQHDDAPVGHLIIPGDQNA